MAPRRLPARLAIAVACASVLLLGLAAAPAHAARPEISGVAVHPWRFDSQDHLPFWPMRDAAVRDLSFAALRAAGVRRARVDMRWVLIERYAKGLRDWAEFDEIYESATKYGVELLPVVAFTPAWANPSGDMWEPPSNPGDFTDFLSAALERYPRIDAWEIWNEPNLGFFWHPAPDVAGFVTLLRAADEARRRVGSPAKLISGGLSSTGADPFAWFDEMARLGAFDLVDGFGIHPYGRTAPDSPKSFFLRLPRFHERLARIGKGHVGLWLTEFGSPNTSATTGYGPPISEEEQAANVGRAYALAGAWPWVKNLTWYELQEGCEDSADPECRFGLLRADMSPKPAWLALTESILGDLPRLRSDTTLRASAGRARAARRARAKRRPRKRPISVTGAIATPGSDDGAATVAVTIYSVPGRGAPRAVRTIPARVRAGLYTASLGSYVPGTWRIVARFAGTDRHLPSESRAATVKIRR